MTTKQTGFRLPENTLGNIEFMVNGGYARTATDAVVRALEYFAEHHRPSIDDEKAQRAVVSYLQTDEGRALIKSICECKEKQLADMPPTGTLVR